MTSRDFAYWLQGMFEIGKPESLNTEQTEMIKRHLALVFIHEIDPSMGGNKEALQAVHDGPAKPPVTQPHPLWAGIKNEPIYRC